MDKDFVLKTIIDLASLIYDLEPDPDSRQIYMIDVLLKDAETAIQMLTKGE
jgi:hypothetical protein